jgi:AraC-like DNA-binding protein
MLTTAHDTDLAPLRHLPSGAGSLTRLACARVRDAGIALVPLLKKAGLSVAQVEDRMTRLPVRAQIRFLDLAAGALQDEWLGFHLARDFDMREIGLLHYVLASCETLEDALQRGARYSTLVNEGVQLSYSDRNDIVIAFDYLGVARHSDRHQIEFWMAASVRTCRVLTGRHLLPHRVQFTHRRHEDYAELSTFLGVEVEFGAPADEVVFPREVKSLAVVSADPYLNDLLIGYCEEALAQRPQRNGGVRAAVENAMAPLLPHGNARVGEVAGRLGLSQRTLARRLAAEGLTFGGVLDRLRSDLALRHVRDSNLSISQIAWLLGYQEVSAFTHAFKRWTGVTPREMRARDDVTRQNK